MIEGLMQIGNILDKKGGSLSNFIENVAIKRRKNPLNICKINFDLENTRLDFDIYEEMDEYSAKKYNFIGRHGGPRSPQWYATSSHIKYHISETINYLSKEDLGEELNNSIKKILDTYYYKFDELSGKYEYILNVEKFNMSNMSMKEIYNRAREGNETNSQIGREIISLVEKEINDFLEENYDMNMNNFGLFTISINDESLATKDGYIKQVLNSKKPKVSNKSKDTGRCSLCLTKENLVDNVNINIKLYTTNQIIFASNLDRGNYYRNMQMCQSCILKYLSGENYIQSKLRTRLAAFDVYIIPQFVYGEPLDMTDLDIVSGKIIDSFNTVKSFSGIEEMRSEIDLTLDMYDRQGYFLLNFLFFRSAQQSTKVQALIKDIEPSIFEKINLAAKNTDDSANKIFNNKFKANIGLNTVYYMNPVRLSRGNPTEFRRILQIYESILMERRVNKKQIIRGINKGIKIIRLEQDGFNIDPGQNSLETYIMRGNFYLRFLGYLNIIEREDKGMPQTLNVKEDLQDFILEMEYNEQQSAMFLLGVLIGEIGNVEYRRSDGGNKPILNKLNFNGIDKPRIIRLVKNIFNKLNQENIREYNEVTFFEMKRLIDKNLDKWKLDKDENLFYILSGYSYVTTRSILYRRDKVVK